MQARTISIRIPPLTGHLYSAARVREFPTLHFHLQALRFRPPNTNSSSAALRTIPLPFPETIALLRSEAAGRVLKWREVILEVVEGFWGRAARPEQERHGRVID